MSEPIRYYDLCVTLLPYERMVKVLEELYENGYRTVAIDHATVYKYNPATKSSPLVIPKTASYLDELKFDFKGKMKILSRVTIGFISPKDLPVKTLAEDVKPFDIVAVMPMNEIAFKHAVVVLDCDIISFHRCSNKEMYKIRRKDLKIAIKREIFFEFRYASMGRDVNLRCRNISIAYMLKRVDTRCFHVIMSSAAGSMHEIRSAKDVEFISFLLGYTGKDMKALIDRNCYALYKRAYMRRCGNFFALPGDRLLNLIETSDEEDMEKEAAETINADDAADAANENNNSTTDDEEEEEENIEPPKRKIPKK